MARNALSVANDYQLAKEAAESVINSRKSQNVKNRLRAELVLCHLMVAEEEQQFQRSSPVIEDSAMMGNLQVYCFHCKSVKFVKPKRRFGFTNLTDLQWKHFSRSFS